MRKVLLAAALLLAGACVALGARAVARRAPRVAEAQGSVRGAWHVHTVRSDGKGTLAEVTEAAREAGLQFVVVTDHNVHAPEDQGYRGGVLVVEGTEASTRYGHVAALGLPRGLTPAERDGDPLGAIAALGGTAVLAHPLHPWRPFGGWGTGPWRGLEVLSNDAAWGHAVATRSWLRVAGAALLLPFDRARAILTLGDRPDALARFDAELRAARREAGGGPARVLLCSADAHGHPSYRAAFEAFSMHLPLALTGDAGADARSVEAALADGRAVCVLDGVAPVAAVRFGRDRSGRGLALALDAPDLSKARFTLLRDGARVAEEGAPARAGAATVSFACWGGCPPGDYRVEGTWDGQPWIFTNPVPVE